jgi:protein SCO1/2
MPITERKPHQLAWLMLLVALCALSAPQLALTDELSEQLETAAANAELDAYRIEPVQVAPFQLQDHTGSSFDHKRLEGRWHLLMFGFTHCPDICPLHLTFLNQASQKLKAAGYGDDAMPQVVMVSVDPERDSLEHLASYVSFFNDTFLGVTGEQDQIEALESRLDSGHRLFSPGVDGNYDVMHGSSVYLIDPQARVMARFQPPFKSQRIAAAYHRFSQEGS